MVSAGVLTFGDFVTKSGRDTPYFVNTGRYRTGEQVHQLANYYADAIQASGVEFDVLFGPAYKGIPLAVSTAMALHQRGVNISYCFNRKEAKDHGEGGTLVGQQLADGMRVLIIEDVTTAGTSLRETIPQLRAAANVELAGLIVSVDRMERGQTEKSALSQISEDYSMPTFPIVTVRDVMAHLGSTEIDGKVALSAEHLEKMNAYLEKYGGA